MAVHLLDTADHIPNHERLTLSYDMCYHRGSAEWEGSTEQ